MWRILLFKLFDLCCWIIIGLWLSRFSFLWDTYIVFDLCCWSILRTLLSKLSFLSRYIYHWTVSLFEIIMIHNILIIYLLSGALHMSLGTTKRKQWLFWNIITLRSNKEKRTRFGCTLPCLLRSCFEISLLSGPIKENERNLVVHYHVCLE